MSLTLPPVASATPASSQGKPAPLPPPEPGPVVPPIAVQELDGMDVAALREALRARMGTHVDLGYTPARQVMFKDVDSHNGQVEDVYTDRLLPVTNLGESYAVNLNTEHTWPKSLGVVDTPAESDLHHLFPTDETANRVRANYPFGEVEVVETTSGPSMLGRDGAGRLVFEPPEDHKGNVARALFYVSTVYDLHIPPEDEPVLREWNHLDPVDGQERERNEQISRFQGNRNTFVDDPALADRIHDF